MLYAKVVLWINEDETISDSKVLLYRGDRNVDIEFTLNSVDYVLSESVEAQLIIVRPHAKSIFSTMHKIDQNKVTFRITGDMIDELTELGSYAIQIRLFGPNATARATLPPCYDVIYIGNPIATESYDEDEIARANYAIVNQNKTISDYDNVGPTFINDLYNKNIWVDGDLITVGRLSKIEDALYRISETDIKQNEKISQFSSGGGGGMTEEERAQLEKNTSDINTILGIVDTPPTYTKPSLTISFNNSTIEHNKSTSIRITPNFNQNDAGSVSSYILYRSGTAIFNSANSSAYTDTITVRHGESVSYNATVSYNDGPIKNTLLGIPYPNTSIKAGSISASGSVRAYALSYYGVINKSTITENDISSLSSRLSTSKSFTYTINLSEQRIVYMYPQSFGVLTSIKDANNFDYINSYTKTTLSYDSVDYYVYILTDPVTITGFKQIFN